MITLPRNMLTSTATVQTPKDTPYGGEYNDPVTIEGVCFEPARTIGQSDYQLQAPIKGTLFIDAHVSRGAFEIPAGSLVSVDGAVSESCVHECYALKDQLGRIHHWEVTLK